MADRDVISTLNTLIQTCRDGEQGFRRASENVRDAELKTIFSEIGRERGQCADELTKEVQRLGAAPATGGSVSGALHRGWMDVKAAVTDEDDKAIVAEAERGEDVAVATFRTALEASLPPDIEAIVRRQFAQVQRAHDRVRALETTARR